MSFNTWQELPVVDERDLRPIISSLTDRLLAEQVTVDLGLSEEDSIISYLNAHCRGFEAGRLVVVNSLLPSAAQEKADMTLSPEGGDCWFQAADFIIRLTDQPTQVCYGGWRAGFKATVFGG